MPEVSIIQVMSGIIDIHTHRITAEKDKGDAIVSLSVGKDDFRSSLSVCLENHIPLSVGLHPWDVKADWQLCIDRELRPLLMSKLVFAIGEVGLDKLRGGLWEWQLAAFRAQIGLAEEVGKPLLVHGVKAVDEIICLRRNCSSRIPWILHGFRGKREQAVQLVKKGFYLSFGEHYHEEALRACPADRLLMETDESTVGIHALYARAAEVRGVDADTLKSQVAGTIENLFVV